METDGTSSTIVQDESSEKRFQFNSSSPTVRVFREAMQSLRKDNVFCDVKFETDDGVMMCGHKVVLSSASPYFHAMFTKFEESNKNNVNIKEMESTTFKLLVDFMYTGQIMITEENVLALLPAASLLQLSDVRDACCEFLKTQLDPTNCIGIKAFADLHGCMELLSSSESYIQQNFSKVVDSNEFLSLSFEQLLTLISSDKLTVPSEEKVFECVICWVNYKPGCRKDLLPKLMEYVRLPLTSSDYLLSRVNEEPLIKKNLECNNYIIEALSFHLLKDKQSGFIPKTIRTKPRQNVGSKVILVVGGENENGLLCDVEWYDTATDRWHSGPDMEYPRSDFGIAVLKDRHVFVFGGRYNKNITEVSNAVREVYYDYADREVHGLDLSSSSPCWVPTVSMLEERTQLGVAVLDNCIYAVGGCDRRNHLKSAEMFDFSTQKWKKISDMSTKRNGVKVGVLDNLLYAVGGQNGHRCLKSVECYHPKTNTWTPIADMSVCRLNAGVGVSGDVLYAVGGYNERLHAVSSVEAYSPSTGVWTSIADMHMCRGDAGVITLNGLLYVVGGRNGASYLDSVEMYDPNSKTWSMLTNSMNISRCSAGVVVIDKSTLKWFMDKLTN